jgi:hypothetical protein
MLNATVSEQDIERLLTGSPAGNGALSDLVPFVEEMRAYGAYAPSDHLVERVAAQAATLALADRESGVTGTKVSPHSRRRWPALSPRVAMAALSVVMVVGMTGVAAAADSAAPGDPLYGLDQAMEGIGIGAGGAAERLEEADQLLTEGQALQALEHAAEAVDGDAAANAALDIAIDRLETVTDQDAASVREKIGDLLDFMSENIGKDKGVDGRDFGQGMAEIARGIASAGEDGTPARADDSEPGDQRPPDDDERGNSDGKGNQGLTNQGTNQGTGTGNSNPPDNGSDPETQPENGNQPGTSGNQGGGSSGAPDNSGVGGSGNGPPADSPSVTAPGRGNRP